MQITFNNAPARATVPFSSVKKGQVVISVESGNAFIKMQACGDRNAVNLYNGLKATFRNDEQVVLAANAVLVTNVDPVNV